MKKTFRNIRTLAALLMAGAAFTACSSDDNISEQPANPAGEKVYTLTVNATKGGDAQTRALEFSGEKLVAKWATTDMISVIKNSSYLGYLSPTNISADGNSATFTGTITTSDLNVGDNLILSYHFHDISAFKNQNGMLNGNAYYSAEAYDQTEATVEVASIDGSNITTTADASFTTQTAMIKFTLQDNAATPNKINATSLNVKATITLPAPLSTTITEDLFTFTIAPEAYTYNGNGILYYALPSAATLAGPIATKLKADPYNLTTITESDVVTLLGSAKVTFTASDGVNTYTVDKTGYPFAAGRYYTSTLTMTKLPKVTWNSTNVFNNSYQMHELDRDHTTPLNYEGITISFSGTGGSFFQPYSPGRGNAVLVCFGEDGDSFTFTAPSGQKFTKIEINDNMSISFTAYGDWTQPAVTKIVWSGTAANAVTLGGSNNTFTTDLNSIVFTLKDE